MKKLKIFWIVFVLTILGSSTIINGALAGGFDDDGVVDGADFLIWQTNFGFSRGEKVEIVYKRRGATTRSNSAFAIEVTNAEGSVIGVIKLEGRNVVRDTTPPWGFGFITLEADENGFLLINGEQFGDLTQNPMTGRYIIGVNKIGPTPLPAGRRVPVMEADTITIVKNDGSTQALAGSYIWSHPPYRYN